MRSHYQLPALPVPEILSYLGDGATQLVERSLTNTSTDSVEALKIFLDLYEEGICIKTDFYPGIKEFLIELKQRGIPAGILTNKPQAMTDKLIDVLDISDLFQFAYGPDVLGKKPDPNGLLHCLKELKVEAHDAVMVGDHHTDMLAGNAAGTKTIFVKFGFGHKANSQVDYEIDCGTELFKFL